jgi:copper chaperone CopZ
MAKMIFHIEGMTCGHCVHAVQGALSSLPGVRKAEVSLDEKKAVVEAEAAFELSRAVEAVEKEGYRAVVAS